MTCSYLPENRTRSMVESLINSGEHLAIAEKIVIGREDELQESMVCGWGRSICFPRQTLSATSRSQGSRRKASKMLPADIDPSNLIVRLVSDDFSVDHLRSTWKANVEPGTYRYISNNGHYRMTKFSAYGPEWATMKRSRLIERTPVASLDIRQTQKMLKKDLDSNFKLQPVLESPSSSRYNSLHQSNGETRPSGPLSQTEKIGETMSSRTDVDRGNNTRPEIPIQRVDSAPSLGSRPPVINSSVHSHSLQNSISHRITNDAFSITGMVRADTVLRPLEKLTPYQKHINRRMSEPNKQKDMSLSTQTGLAMNGCRTFSNKASSCNVTSAQASDQAENDILSRLRNRLNVPEKDDGKSGLYSFLNNNVIKDYSRFLNEKVNAPLLGTVNGTVKPMATHRKVPMPSKANGGAHLGTNVASNNEFGKRAALETNSNPTSDPDFALPEISGKRIAVAATLHNRIL